MFGNLNKTPFGAAAPNTTFGFGTASTSSANPFGQSQNLFGKPAAGGFGSPSTSTFGQPATTSLFPSTQPQQTNLFQNANPMFGQTPTTQSGFGSNLFSQQQQQQPATGGLFNTSSSFGQQNKPTGFGFGTAQNQQSLFGQQPQQQTNVFQTTSTPLFGTGTSFGPQQAGTVVKFNPVTGTDTMLKNGVSQNINTKHHSITCMKEYENKSFEELRFEDYQANRKGPQQQSGFGGTPFGGTPASTSSLFGQTDVSKPGFGQTTGFGATTATFGQNTSGFGMGAQNTSAGLFGQKPGVAFGAPTSSTGTTFGFGGAPQNANPFGAGQTNKPFGSTSQPFMGTNTMQPSTGAFSGGLFGQPNTQNTTSLFGGKQTQPTTGFGQTGQTAAFSFNTPASTQSSSLFGTTNKPLFGQTSTTPGFMGMTNTMGAAQPSFGGAFAKPAATGFGATPQTGFGTNIGMQNQNTSLFGNMQNKPGGLFGNTTTTGLFGNAGTTFNTGSTGFGMGQPQQQQQSLFLQSDQNIPTNISMLTCDPFGDAPHLFGLEPKLKTAENNAMSATDPKELKSLLDASKKVDVSQNAKLKIVPLKSIKDSLFEGVSKQDDDNSAENNLNGYVKSNVRRLVLKNKPKNAAGESLLSPSHPRPRSNILDILEGEDNKENKEKSRRVESRANSMLNLDLKANPVKLNFDTTVANEIDLENVHSPSFNINFSKNASTPAKDTAADVRSNTPLSFELDNDTTGNAAGDALNVPEKPHPTGIICTRPEYYTLPCLDALTQYIDESGACIVKGFTIGRKGYGNVYFPDEMDVSGLNVDELVHFRYREINVYPDESKKPPIGRGLNRKAQVTLDNVYPRKAGTNALIKDVAELLHMGFAERLRKVTEKKGARFVDYRPETGSWVFRVEHFSRYGFNDSDEEGDQNGGKGRKEAAPKKAEGSGDVEKKKKEEEGKKETPSKEVVSQKLALENDIYIDDDDQSNEEDMLHHSMYVDNISEDNYYQIPPTGVPMDTFDAYKSTKSIQVMKSTLFADDDRSSDGAASHISIIKQYLDLQDEMLPTLPTVEEEAPARKRAVMRPTVYKVYNYGGADARPKLLPSRIYADTAAYKGRSFKVSFSKGFDFCTLSSVDGEVAMNTFEVKKDVDPLKDILDETLQTVLDESTCSISASRVPTFKIVKGPSFLKKQTLIFEKLANNSVCRESNYMHSVWTLCDSLWGPSEDSIHHRRHLLSEWLKINALNADVSLKTQQFFSIDETVRAVFSHLTVFRIFEAANISMENRLPSLSMIVSQVSLRNATKMFVREQIETWYDSMASQHISDDLKKVYLLLSGIATKEDVNVFDDVDWKRSFGMHLWYMCQNGAPVETVIEEFRKAFEEFGYSERPNPPYMDRYKENGAFDILYHVLWLYKSRIHRLSSVLNPETHTTDPLDYRLSWLLLQLFLSLNVGLIEDCELTKITTSFSNQLENLGKWEWAIFVLLYLNDDNFKKKLITEILDRNLIPECDKETIQSQNNLVNNMEIPAEWIHVVKAEKLVCQGRFYEAFNHFSHAKEYIKANEILVDKILPNLFINEQFDTLKMFINAIKKGSKDVLHWENQAGLFDEFLDLQQRIVSFNAEEILRLQMDLQAITSKIRYFPLKTNEQKLCIAELSKRCASLYKDLCRKQKTLIFKDSYTQMIDNLVMPPDYSHLEALYLIHEEI